MTRTRHRPARGFTLVELLTVISIIALLISILLPSLAKARAQAKKVKVQSQIKAIGDGLEMFRNDNREQYPASARAQDRITDWPNATTNNMLSGAHWLARAMVGGDLQGIDVNGEALKPLNPPAIPSISYQSQYGPSVSPRQYERRGAYIQLEAAPAVPDTMPEKAPNPTSSNAPNTGRLILLDGYGYPILYYRAEPAASLQFTQSRKNGQVSAVYVQEDNADFAGSELLSKKGWDLKPGRTYDDGQFNHAIARYTNTLGPNGRPGVGTYCGFFLNQDVYDATNTSGTTGTGAIKPYNADSFILLSAGDDAIYGTSDDVKNFKIAN